jgi:hypothetical protein
VANLWVIVTGLAVLVERESGRDPHAVVLRQVPRGTEVPPDGREIQQHIPRLRLLPGVGEIPIGSRDVTFLPEGEGSPRIIDLDPFIRVGKKLTEAMPVRPYFLTTSRTDDLGDWSRVFLAGGRDSDITPIHVGEDFKLNTIGFDLPLDLIAARDLRRAEAEQRRKSGIANGLLYYRHIPEGVPEVLFSNDRNPIPWERPLKREERGNLPEKNNEGDYVAWVSNAGIGRDLGEDFDRDFYLLYDLLVESVTRYVPVIQGLPLVNPPGQCMIGYAFGGS